MNSVWDSAPTRIGLDNRGDMTGMCVAASHLPGDGTKCFAINDNGADP